MSTNSSFINPTPEQATAQFDSSIPVVLSSADADAAIAVQNLGLVQQARLSQLTRTANISVVEYGATSKQATAAQSAVALTQSAASRITLVNQQVTTPAPTVTATGWALHGRVYDSNSNPLSNYTVFLVDTEKNYLNAYGFSYTDSTGYFLINYPGTAAAPAAGQAEGSAQQAPSDTAAAATDLYLEVVDAKANPVFLSTTAFQPVVGSATYQVVTLPAGEPALGDPPATIRAVALPPKKKKG
jgi:hypothetical protein